MSGLVNWAIKLKFKAQGNAWTSGLGHKIKAGPIRGLVTTIVLMFLGLIVITRLGFECLSRPFRG